MTKAFWLSRTVWYGVLVIALALAELIPATHWSQVVIGAIIIALRFVTGKPLASRKRANGPR